MDPNVKSQWLQALRSGKYEQGKGMLHTDVGFCCLGVLCDLHDKKRPLGTPSGWAKDMQSYQGHVSALSDNVRVWAGLPDRNPKVQFTFLATLNDDGMSFVELANIIEESL